MLKAREKKSNSFSGLIIFVFWTEKQSRHTNSFPSVYINWLPRFPIAQKN